MAFQGVANVGQVDAFDLPLRPVAAHENLAKARVELGRRAIAAGKGRIAPLPLLVGRVNAEAGEVVQLPFGAIRLAVGEQILAQGFGLRRGHRQALALRSDNPIRHAAIGAA